MGRRNGLWLLSPLPKTGISEELLLSTIAKVLRIVLLDSLEILTVVPLKIYALVLSKDLFPKKCPQLLNRCFGRLLGLLPLERRQRRRACIVEQGWVVLGRNSFR